jgi:hypothetical protein
MPMSTFIYQRCCAFVLLCFLASIPLPAAPLLASDPQLQIPYTTTTIEVAAGREFIIPYQLLNVPGGYLVYPRVIDSDLELWIRHRSSNDYQNGEVGGYAWEKNLGTHQIELIVQKINANDEGILLRKQITLKVVESCAQTEWYLDKDGDGYGGFEHIPNARSCTQPLGMVANHRDCDDTNAAIHPAASELEDSVDNNCTGVVDEKPTDNLTPFVYIDKSRGTSGATPHVEGDEYIYLIEVTNPEPDEAVTVSINDDWYPDDVTFTPALPYTGTGTFTIEAHWAPEKAWVLEESVYIAFLTLEDAAGNKKEVILEDVFPSELPQIQSLSDTFRIGLDQPYRITFDFWDDHCFYESYMDIISASIPYDHYFYENSQLNNPEGVYASTEHIGLQKIILRAPDCRYSDKEVIRVVYIEVDPTCTNKSWYPDKDGDGFGYGQLDYPVYITCSPPAEGWADNNLDCDDSDSTIYPGAEEIPGDGRDNNCNGVVDEKEHCTTIAGLTVASTCSDNPRLGRAWVIHNPNPCPVEVHYDLRQSAVSGTLIAQPGETHFQTPFIERNMNIMQLHWQDEAGKEQMYRYREPANTGLRIFTVCSDEPQKELHWRVHNPNPCPYYVAWEIKGSDQRGSYIAPPGDSYVTTTTIPNDPNVAVLMYYNYHSKKRYSRQASAYRQCSDQQNAPASIVEAQAAAAEQEPLALVTELAVYPVPFRQQLTLEHEGILSGTRAKVMLIGLDGRSLDVSAQIVEQGKGYLQLNLQEVKLANGLYILRLDISGQEPVYKRVLRQD